ncbi:TaqI-like C-terminal specificity domain-containing protein [Chryseobacterium timonianum]|uniref:TaqI-like C-terminal specificity domain-containing protein n=1 Tax=Chryseobacterium timonianum TaxID=1805473 RepID=UPI00083ABC78|nr:TaqI-like C-terminal specificity domain-containing protein [Chryseobacterium timonianum]
MSDYFRQNSSLSSFSNSESWVILSLIEQQIKKKIEKIGTPLKDWNIRINYGIKTGFNDAFIIDGAKRKELINQDPKSEEIIRPLLRGRDIKRYSYEFADLYLITTFPSLKIDIELYPVVKQHLISFGYDRLKQTGDKGARKKTNNQWFETQDSISYWEDFSIQKIMYPNMTKFLPFYLDDKGFMQNDKSFMITGKHLSYLTAFLNSSLFKYCFIDNFPELQGGTRELRKIFLDKIPVLEIDNDLNSKFEIIVSKIQANIDSSTINQLLLQLDKMIFDLYGLSEEERTAIGFIEIQ